MVMKANSHRYIPTFPIHLYKEPRARYSALTAGCYFFTYPSEAKKTNYLRVDSTAMISHSKINAIPLLHIIVSRGSSNALRAKSDEGNENERAGYGDGDTLRAPANFQLREAFYWMMAEIKLLAAVARLWANENIYIII